MATIAPRYDAFLSYSHAVDQKLAPALQHGLHRFAKPLWQRRALRVFRDDTNLAANPGLWTAIEDALAASRFFVLLASPESARSKWVHREIDFWCRNKTPETCLIVLTDGEIAWGGIGDFDWHRTTGIPTRLRGVFREEPHWIDLRWARNSTDISLRNPRFREAVADLAAPLHDRPKDDLIGDDIRHHRRAIRIRNGALVAFAVLFLVASISAFVAIQQRNEAEMQAHIARAQKELAEAQRNEALRSQSLFLAERSTERLRAGDTGTAVRLALEALPEDLATPDRPYVRQAEIALARALERNREEIVLRGHTAAIMSLDFSPDGRRLITASKDESARIWDVATGTLQGVLAGGGGAILDARFSSDGQRVLTVTQEGKARLWNADNAEVVASINDQPQRLFVIASPGEVSVVEPSDRVAIGDDAVYDARFSPINDVVLGVKGDGTICFWGAVTGDPRDCFEVHGEGIRSITDASSKVAFSPDGQMFVTTGSQAVHLWDTAERRPIASLEGHEIVSGATFSSDGKWLLVTDSMGWASLWDVSKPALGVILEGHEGGIYYGAISSDGKRLVTASEDQTARLWVGPSYGGAGRLWATLSGHEAPIVHAAFSTDGNLVATASVDGSARVWTTERGVLVETLRGHGGSVLKVQFSPRGNILATAGNDGTARLWTFGEIQSHITLDIGEAGVDAAWSPDGRNVVTPHRDSSAQIWDATTGKATIRLAGHEAAVVGALVSADGGSAATLTENGSVRIWNASTGKLKHLLATEGAAATEIAFSADGRSLFGRLGDEGARVWDVETGKIRMSFRGEKDRLRTAAMSPDGRHILIGGPWGTQPGTYIQLWDVTSGERASRIGDGRTLVTRAGFSPDSQMIYATADDGSVRLWDADSHELLSHLNAYQGLWGNPDLKVRFTADSTAMATFSVLPESRIRVWETRSGALLTVMNEASDQTNDVSISPSKRWLVSASQDRTARLWDVETGLLAAVFSGHRESVSRVSFSPDGQRILTTSSDGTARVWGLPPMGQELIELARMRVPQPLTPEQRKRFFLAFD